MGYTNINYIYVYHAKKTSNCTLTSNVNFTVAQLQH